MAGFAARATISNRRKRAARHRYEATGSYRPSAQSPSVGHGDGSVVVDGNPTSVQQGGRQTLEKFRVGQHALPMRAEQFMAKEMADRLRARIGLDPL